MYQKILAPLDGSELSESSLSHVKAVATGCGVPQVVLLEVIEPPTLHSEFVELDDSALQEMLKQTNKQNRTAVEGYLSKVGRKLKKDGVAAKTVIREGSPAEEILNYAAKNKVDLIILATHGRSGASRWVFGSVADRIVRHSPVPVLIVTPSGSRGG